MGKQKGNVWEIRFDIEETRNTSIYMATVQTESAARGLPDSNDIFFAHLRQ
jgi:hypothetical protein